MTKVNKITVDGADYGGGIMSGLHFVWDEPFTTLWIRSRDTGGELLIQDIEFVTPSGLPISVRIGESPQQQDSE